MKISKNTKIFKKTKVKKLHELRKIISEKYDKNGAQIDLRDIDVSELSDFSWIFSFCPKVKTVDISGWKFNGNVSLDYMFYDCIDLEEIKGIENLDVTKTNSLAFMFCNCKSLTKLDLSKWNVFETIISTKGMFQGCVKLNILKGVNSWKYIKDKDNMFKNCQTTIIPSWYKE